jgi:phosphohistidine phosphatase
MKILTLIRHAKSSWDQPGLDDIDRPLNPRGRHDAPLMGSVLARRGFAPDRFFTSPALRALRTAQAIAAALGRPASWIRLDDRWYHRQSKGLLDVLRSLAPELQWVACVGHNPALTELVNRLAGKKVDNVPTAGIVQLHFEIDQWTQLGQVRALRMEIDFPKNHYGPRQQGQAVSHTGNK